MRGNLLHSFVGVPLNSRWVRPGNLTSDTQQKWPYLKGTTFSKAYHFGFKTTPEELEKGFIKPPLSLKMTPVSLLGAFDKSQHADGHERACDKFRRHPCRKPMDFLTQPMDFLTQIFTPCSKVWMFFFGGGKTHNWLTATSHTNYA